MKLLSWKERGLIGLKKGIGVDEISLDLSKISGLCALDAENGRGKSTVLESLPPYAIMPSRKGALQHQFFLKDSCLDREYLFNGDRIRCLVKINGGSNYSPEGFIWINDQPKVSGKISEYKNLIKDIFGSQELFYNSAFCSQGSENLNDLDPADLKNLFAEFLQLHKYLKWEEVSKTCGKILNGRLSAIEKAIMILEGKKQQYTLTFITEEAITAEKTIKESLEKEVIRLTGNISTQTEKIEAEKKKLVENDKLQARISDIGKALSQVKTDIEADTLQSNKELNALREKAQVIFGQLKQHEETLKGKAEIERAVSDIETLTNDLKGHREDLEKGNEVITGFTTKIIELEKNHRAITDKANTAETLISTTINELKKVRGERQVSIEKAKGAYSTAALESELVALRKQAEILEQRKSDPACPDIMAQCMFVNAAYTAFNLIPDIERQIEEKKQDLRNVEEENLNAISWIDSQIQEKQEVINGIKTKALEDANIITDQIKEKELHRDIAADKIRQLKEHIVRIEKRILELRPLANKADQIKVAESQIETLKKQKEEITKEGMEIKTKWDNRINNLRLRETEMADQIKDIEALMDKEVEPRLQSLENELKELDSLLKDAVNDSIKSDNKIKDLEREAQEIEKLNQELSAANNEKKVIAGQMDLWLYCQLACGKDGLRALEIDSVVPNIVHETNELLSSSNFGTIKIITQDPDTGKEVFRLMVIDDDGEEVPLDVRSGGEKIWPVQALRLGMTLISKQKSPFNYLTAFNDELDGPLDVENAKRFISLYPKFMARGGFDTCFYITHKRECVELADHRLIFQQGGIVIE